MKTYFLGVLLVISFWGLLVQGQDKLKSKYEPTEIQMLRLEVKQREAQLAQKDFFIAQQNLNTSLKALNDEAARVKTENKWPDGLVFSQEKLSFTEDSKLPAKPVQPGRVQ